jgi:hypothetical protein
MPRCRFHEDAEASAPLSLAERAPACGQQQPRDLQPARGCFRRRAEARAAQDSTHASTRRSPANRRGVITFATNGSPGSESTASSRANAIVSHAHLRAEQYASSASCRRDPCCIAPGGQFSTGLDRARYSTRYSSRRSSSMSSAPRGAVTHKRSSPDERRRQETRLARVAGPRQSSRALQTGLRCRGWCVT